MLFLCIFPFSFSNLHTRYIFFNIRTIKPVKMTGFFRLKYIQIYDSLFQKFSMTFII